MKKYHTDAIRAMRNEGIAVIVFSPEELDGVDRQDFEEAMVSQSSDIIDNLKPFEDDDD